MNVLVHAPLPREFATQIQALSPDVSLTVAAPQEPLPLDALREAEVLYSGQARFPMEQAPRLRWLQTNTAAVNQLAGQPILSSDVLITSARGAYTVAVAECAFAMMLAMTRRLPRAVCQQAAHQWETATLQGAELYGKTLGIVGYGSIGRQIARLASAFGMNVLACKRQPAEHLYSGFALPNTGDPGGVLPQAWYGIEQLKEMFCSCDVVVVTLPLTTGTRDLIGAAELAALPGGAYFVNVGRGGVVSEEALLALLREGKLAGAALDVFAEEPLAAHSPLWDAPNTLILPHIASWTTAQAERAAAVFVENLRRYLGGRELFNSVDKDQLY